MNELNYNQEDINWNTVDPKLNHLNYYDVLQINNGSMFIQWARGFPTTTINISILKDVYYSKVVPIYLWQQSFSIDHHKVLSVTLIYEII